MPPQPDDIPATDEQRTERAILGLLTTRERGQLWALPDLVRAIGPEPAVSDALASLQAAGLIHTVADTCVFASQAAICACELW